MISKLVRVVLVALFVLVNFALVAGPADAGWKAKKCLVGVDEPGEPDEWILCCVQCVFCMTCNLDPVELEISDAAMLEGLN